MQDAPGSRLRVLQENLASISGRLDSALRLLSVISALTHVQTQAQELGQAAEQMLSILVQGLDNILNCSIMLYEPQNDHLRMLAVQGQAEFFGETVSSGNQHLTFQPGEGIAGQAFAEGQPIFWRAQLPEQSDVKVFADSDIPAAIACLPLNSKAGCLGVLNLSFTVPLDFTFAEKRNAVLLGQVVANVIDALILKNQLAAK